MKRLSIRAAVSRVGRAVSRNRTAVILLSAQVVVASGALVVNVLSARALGPTARGELALFLQIAYAANLICMLGRQRAFLRFPAKNRALSASYSDARRLSALPLVTSAIAAAVVGFSFHQWHISAAILMIAFFVKSSSGVIVNMHRAAAISAQTATPFLAATIGSQTLLAVGSLVFAVGRVDTPEPWLLLYGITAIVPYLVVEIVVVVRHPARGRDRSELNEISSLGLRLVPAGFAEAVLARADRFLIPIFSTYAQLGIYSVVLTMTELIAWPASQYAQSKVPIWRVAYEEGRLRWFGALSKVMLLCTLIAVGVGLVIYIALVPIFGDAYAAGHALIVPLVIASVFQCATSLGASMAVAVGRPVTVATISLVGMLVALPSLLILIPTYGAAGAAWAMVAGHGVSAAVALTLVGRIVRLQDETRGVRGGR